MKSLQGGFEQGIEQVAQSAKQTVKQQTTAIAQAAKSQFVPQKADPGTQEQGATGIQQGSSSSDQAGEQAVSNAAAQQQKQGSSGGQKKPSPFYQRQITKGNTPEEAANLEKIRNELHKQYFEDLTNRPKPKAEIVVARKQEEMTALEQEKEKKKLPPLPVQRKQRRIENLLGSG